MIDENDTSGKEQGSGSPGDAFAEIRKKGERFLDEFMKLENAELEALLPHLEEIKKKQEDILAILDEIKELK